MKLTEAIQKQADIVCYTSKHLHLIEGMLMANGIKCTAKNNGLIVRLYDNRTYSVFGDRSLNCMFPQVNAFEFIKSNT